jgi:pyruvoyl-dependent arginine decarboxylase (PvlArgDC)
MIGSMILPGVGTAIGAAAGALWSLYGSYQESEAKREAKEAEDKAKREAADAKTKEMVEALTSRPIHLNVGGKTILEYNNASTMYGTDSNILAK